MFENRYDCLPDFLSLGAEQELGHEDGEGDQDGYDDCSTALIIQMSMVMVMKLTSRVLMWKESQVWKAWKRSREQLSSHLTIS